MKSATNVKPDFQSDPINHVEVWAESNLSALVTWGGWVRLFGTKESAVLLDLFTRKSSGGVSVAISEDDRRCFAGTYDSWGLACFDVASGEVLWKRADLKMVHGLEYSPSLRKLFAFFDGKPVVQIDPKTGATETTFRGISYVAASRVSGLILLGDKKTFTMIDGAFDKLWSTSRESFAVHAVGWSAESVLISEVSESKPNAPRSGLRCFSVSAGVLRWRYQGRH